MVRSPLARFVTAGAAALLSLLAILPAAAAPERVEFSSDLAVGTIVVRTAERRLYLVIEGGEALRYPIGVGRPGRQWQGDARIDGMFVKPNWAPPAEILADNPNLPPVIPGGAPNNPMGAAAMTLSGGAYAIHGTNAPDSIGGFVSYGCIRMHNADIADLFARVRLGTPVLVRH